jgi:hypothetical protein
VQTGTQVEAELADVGDDRLRAADRTRRPVEGCEEAVACGVELPPTEAGELTADCCVMTREKIAPRTSDYVRFTRFGGCKRLPAGAILPSVLGTPPAFVKARPFVRMSQARRRSR